MMSNSISLNSVWSSRLFIALLLFIIQGSPLFSVFRFLGVAPNLLVIFLILEAFHFGIPTGIAWGFFIGLLLDLSSGTSLINTMTLPLVGVLIGVLRSDIFKDDLIIKMGIVILGTFAWSLGHDFFFALFYESNTFWNIYKLFFLIGLHAIIAPILVLYFPRN